jgi:hypothetical protein
MDIASSLFGVLNVLFIVFMLSALCYVAFTALQDAWAQNKKIKVILLSTMFSTLVLILALFIIGTLLDISQ